MDGDTVVLSNQRSLRLIGLNTPELTHRTGHSHEPLAQEARAALVRLLAQTNDLSVLYGEERFDSHGRTLGHLFLTDGTNVQARLIAQGLGFAIAIPPNLAFVDCYAAAEKRARNARAGLWSQAYFNPRPAGRISSGDRGFRRIRGRIQKITHTAESIWLALGTRVSLRIDRRDLEYFPPGFLDVLPSEEIVARGWLTGSRRLRIHIRHPLDLEFHLRSD